MADKMGKKRAAGKEEKKKVAEKKAVAGKQVPKKEDMKVVAEKKAAVGKYSTTPIKRNDTPVVTTKDVSSKVAVKKTKSKAEPTTKVVPASAPVAKVCPKLNLVF